MSEVAKRLFRRPWSWAVAIVAVAVFLAIRPGGLTETERQMLGTWRWRDSRMEYTFRSDRRLVVQFRNGPSFVGRWSASRGNLDVFQPSPDPPLTIARFLGSVTRIVRRPAPTPPFAIDFPEEDLMRWSSGGTVCFLDRVKSPEPRSGAMEE